MRVAIVLNGDPFSRRITEDYIICADGGFNRAAGYTVNCVVGDMDSVSLLPVGIKALKVPSIKNYSDGELAVKEAAAKGAKSLSIYGAFGGRPDHVFANLRLLVLADSLGITAVIKGDSCDVYYFKDSFTLSAQAGQIVSIMSHGDSVSVKSSKGLRYPLDGLIFTAKDAGLGLSNIVTLDKIDVDIEKGSLFFFVNF